MASTFEASSDSSHRERCQRRGHAREFCRLKAGRMNAEVGMLKIWAGRFCDLGKLPRSLHNSGMLAL